MRSCEGGFGWKLVVAPETIVSNEAAVALGTGAFKALLGIGAGRRSAASSTSDTAATAPESTTTCHRRVGSDVAPSMSSITSAQLVRQVGELRDGQRA